MDPARSGQPFRPAPSLARALEAGAVAVGTRNEAKLEAVRRAFAGFVEAGAGPEIRPVEVPSGVPEQPIGWSEIVAGARNRARAALASGGGELGLGIEDGLVRLAEGGTDGVDATGAPLEAAALAEVFNVGCAWITDGEREAHGFSAAFGYPPACLAPALAERAPIGDGFDALWRRARLGPSATAGGAAAGPPAEPADEAPSGRRGGNIGRLTGGRLDRAAYGEQAVVCALVRFLHTDLYD